MAGTGFSGKDGDVKIGTTAINEIKAWTFNPKANNVRYASNATGGYKRTVAGVKEGSGTCSGVYTATATFHTVIDVGTSVALKLYLNATLFYSVPAVISDYKLTVDLDSGEIVGWEASFETDGAWTNATSSMMAADDMLPMTAQVSPEEFGKERLAATGAKIMDTANANGDLDPRIKAAIESAVKSAVEQVEGWKELAEWGVLQRDLTKKQHGNDVAAAAVEIINAG
jgi:hypothetical protein